MRFNTIKAKELVEGSRLKRSAIADECGVDVKTLTNHLNGHTVPSRSVVKLMAQILEVPESELVFADEIDTSKKSA